MTLNTVDSTAIHAIGYNPDTRVLEIIFTSGGIYHFKGVPAPIYYRMKRAHSMGRFFQENIRGRYPHVRVSRPGPRSRKQAQATLPGTGGRGAGSTGTGTPSAA